MARMASNALFAEVAALAGDPARAGMLHALMDGRALTASELAQVAGITPQTASSHLGRHGCGRPALGREAGRHRYHRLASPAVARMMESIMQVASRLEPASKRLVVGPRDAALRAARTCYDHLAGHLGVALADAMVRGGQVELARCRPGDRCGRAFARPDRHRCRRPHGPSRQEQAYPVPAVPRLERAAAASGWRGGAALCAQCFAKGWIRRIKGTRAVAITPMGQRIFRDEFGVQAT